MEEIAVEAINHALRALRKRHLLEEAAHLPALTALSRPIIHQVPPLSLILFFLHFFVYNFSLFV